MPASRVRRCLTLLIPVLLGGAERALAFPPEASLTVASRALAAWPAPPEGWDFLLAMAMEAQLDADIPDADSASRRRRFDAGAPLSCPAVQGEAPFEFARAVERLGAARVSGDAGAIASHALWIATLACDLSDPFRMTAPRAAELPGARAAFADALPESPLPKAAPEGTALEGDRTLDAALALAVSSAALRDSAEALGASAGGTVLAALQRARLGAALALAGGAMLGLEAAAIPADTPGRVSVWPNPSRSWTRISFHAGRGGAGWTEVFDPSGRRVMAEPLGVMTPGAQVRSLDATRIAALPAGIYFVRLTIGGMRLHGRLVRAAH